MHITCIKTSMEYLNLQNAFCRQLLNTRSPEQVMKRMEDLIGDSKMHCDFMSFTEQ